MGRYFPLHADHPEPRALGQAVEIVRDGGLIAYPTDSAYALGCRLGNKDGLERMRSIRQLKPNHDFTLLCSEFAQLGTYVQMDNWVFRAIKAATPGAYTFILPGTRETPRVMLHPKKRTVGVRVPDHITAQALLERLGEPLVSTTLWLPDDEDPLTDGWEVQERLEHQVDAVLDSGDCGHQPTTVVDFTHGDVEIVRVGGGDPAPFEG